MHPSDRLQLVHPAREATFGLSLLGVDLGEFFVIVRNVGADPALVLLTARALALRRGGAITFRDLGWILGMRQGGVLSALRRLSDAGAVVWHDEAGRGVVAVEVVRELPGERPLFGPDDTPPFSTHALPTHWFVQVLPLMTGPMGGGRRAFLAYLYLRSRERRDGLTSPVLVSAIRRSCQLRRRWLVTYVLWRLRRRGLVAPVSRYQYAVADPRPPSGRERRFLRLLELGLIPPTAIGRIALILAVLGPMVLLAVAVHFL